MTIYYEESRISSITFVKTENDLKSKLSESQNSNLIINPEISIPIYGTNYPSVLQELINERAKLIAAANEIELGGKADLNTTCLGSEADLGLKNLESPILGPKDLLKEQIARATATNEFKDTDTNETSISNSEIQNTKSNSDIQLQQQINDKVEAIDLSTKIENCEARNHIIEINNTISDIKKQINAQADIELQKIIDNILNLQNAESLKTIIINAESSIFHDIEFSIDSNKVEINSQSVHQEPLSGISLGNSVMLDSLMEQHFVILPGRKSSNIKSNLNQNHGCIDAIAINGLMNSPKIMSEYSVGKLINAISKNKKLKNLDIYIIHSALKVNIITYHGLSDVNIPCYAIGKGEILSVFFRYLALTFFPYMTICDSSESVDYKYDI